MSDYDAIVVGAGHNGLTAAALLQRAGLHTVCPGGQHLRRRHGRHRRVDRRLPLRDRRVRAVPHPQRDHQGPRAGHAAHRRRRRDVGQHRRGRRRGDDLLPRPDGTDDPSVREARQRGCHGHGRTDRVEPRPGKGVGPLRCSHNHRRLSTRCMPAPPTKPSAAPSTRPCSARRWTSSTATCPTRRSTPSCAACSPSSRSTPPTAGPTPPAARPASPSPWPSPTRAPR